MAEAIFFVIPEQTVFFISFIFLPIWPASSNPSSRYIFTDPVYCGFKFPGMSMGKASTFPPPCSVIISSAAKRAFLDNPFFRYPLHTKIQQILQFGFLLRFSIKKKIGPVSIDLFEDFRPSKLSPGDRKFAHVIDDASCYPAHDPVPMEVFVLFPAHFLERT